MNLIKSALVWALLLIGAILMAFLLLLLVTWLSSSNAKQTNAECSMLIIEKKISPELMATEYRRACMAAKGYGMLPSCYFENNIVASCFIPRWMFWINTV
ncbi:hypothetical protein DSM25558_0172 [Agrobacterium sp. DSM 25558]|uniref:hypothetical protein n=1 Tax=Agrobacterium sp. DSM 25558 TaxID=1907665 RepID=UPI0009724F9F|nr:hypothetical protein [Agrobacterium sp. DSM 25558]SCX00753.1 hypothetical protein DSM25558_0172 [Agrobacterium sp. DSM 25558]